MRTSANSVTARAARERSESVESRIGEGGLQCGGVFGEDADGVQHPAAPAFAAQEQPAAPLVAGRVEMRGAAVPHGGLQGRGKVAVQASEQMQEADTEPSESRIERRARRSRISLRWRRRWKRCSPTQTMRS